MKFIICIKPAGEIARTPIFECVSSVHTSSSDNNSNPFHASWSAKGHTLCLGHWIIRYNNSLLVLPPTKAENHMDTFGIFSWLFPDDEDYAEGLELADWLDENAQWLITLFEQHDIPVDEQNVQWFYEAVNKSDWRCGSCGGCM